MKFGKELAAQMVHEWQEAYVDYNYLKTLLKDVRLFRQRCSPPPSAAAIAKGGLKRRVSLYRAFSGLTTGRSRGSAVKNEDEVILVNAVQNEGSDSSEYHTMFLMLSDDGGEYELLFFKRLDHEFNKVLNFYKKKVEEVMVEADELSKQMNALIALRIKVDDPVVGGAKMINVDSIDEVSGNSLRVNPRTVLEAEMSSEILSEEPRIDKEDESNRHCEANGRDDARGFRPAPLKVLDHVKINITPETGVSTVKHILKSSKLGVSFNKQELKKVESQMARALVEFYRELQLLKNY